MKYERNFHLLNGKFRELFIPTLLAAVAGNFATLGDAFVISTFLGSTNLSVVQSISPLTQFVNMLYWIIGFGGTILCTTARANFDKKQANQIFSLSMITIILSSVIITLLGVLFPDSFMQILCNSSQLRPLVYEYFRIYIFCIPFMCSTVVLAYFIRTDDFVQLQFRALLLINCLNVILDIFFIEFLKYGIGGAALGTTLSFFIGTVYISTYFMSNRRTLKLIKIDVKNSFKNLVDICKTGFSSSSIALYQAIKLVLINSLLLGVVGHVGLVAFNMCSQSVFIVSIFIFGTAQSILPIVAIYYEEDDHNGVAYVAKISLKIVMVFGILFTVLFGVFPESLLFLFSVNNPADIPTVITAVRIFSLCFLGYAVTFLYIFYAQSVQYTRLANIITFLNGLAFPIIFAYIFSYFWQENGIWFAFVISESLSVVFIYLYSRYITKKSGGEYRGFFLNKRPVNMTLIEHTIPANMDDAMGVSKLIEKELPESSLSHEIGETVERMIVNVIGMNDELEWIDIIIRDKENSVVISIKNSGLGFHEDEEYDELKSDYYTLKDITDDIEYSKILGLNNTVITIKK